MKTIAILSLLFLVSPAFSELTKEDIRTIVREEVRPIIKEEITASEKRMKEYVDLKVDGLEKSVSARIDGVDQRIVDVDKKFDRVWLVILGLIGLITAAIAVPQVIIAFKEKGQKEMQLQIDQLREQLQSLQNPPS